MVRPLRSPSRPPRGRSPRHSRSRPRSSSPRAVSARRPRASSIQRLRSPTRPPQRPLLIWQRPPTPGELSAGGFAPRRGMTIVTGGWHKMRELGFERCPTNDQMWERLKELHREGKEQHFHMVCSAMDFTNPASRTDHIGMHLEVLVPLWNDHREKVLHILEMVLRNKTADSIFIWCRSGKHRSVALAYILSEVLADFCIPSQQRHYSDVLWFFSVLCFKLQSLEIRFQGAFPIKHETPLVSRVCLGAGFAIEFLDIRGSTAGACVAAGRIGARIASAR